MVNTEKIDGGGAVLDRNHRSYLLADFLWGTVVNLGEANSFHPWKLSRTIRRVAKPKVPHLRQKLSVSVVGVGVRTGAVQDSMATT